MVNVKLKGDIVKQYKKGIDIESVAKDLSISLYKSAVAAKVNGQIVDLRDKIEEDCSLEILTFDDKDGKMAFWHSSAHILAQAVKRLYKDAKLSIGPSIDGGFFYDFDVEKPFTPEELLEIEKEFKSICKEKINIERFYLEKEDALKWALDSNEPYKAELIKEHAEKGERLSFYRHNDFVELCSGPHILNTSLPKAVKLTQTTGAYFKGDSNNKMLCRVYGVSFPKESMLTEHMNMLEEAKKRDHRKLGKELDIFDIFEYGPGFPFFLKNGMIIRNELENYWKEEHKKENYNEIKTPIMLNKELWETSGHWDYYKENMYTTVIDDNDFAIKPMNCPGCMLVYKRDVHSYRELPLKIAELGLVHRHELSGALHGLMRVRTFTQDDAHIFMTEGQVKQEIINVINLAKKMYKTFGFEYRIELSTRPENYIGTVERWDKATQDLKSALEEMGIEYVLNEGDGAFYGPKIDFHLKDCIGRTWQCGTIQLDFQLPERFDVSYINEDGSKSVPVTVHRTIFGSIERFIGILIEHYAGAFPLWLNPIQVKVIPVSQKQNDYVEEVLNILLENGIRAQADYKNEKLGYKIREAQMKKASYMLILGDLEKESKLVGVRSRKDGDLGTSSIEDFVKRIKHEIKCKI